MSSTCGVCFENYSSTDQDKKPKVMPCGHTTCSGCISNVSLCPICRFVLPLDKSKIPYNFGLMDNIEIKEKLRTKYVSNVCVICKLDATFVCKDCDKTDNVPLCQACFDKEHTGFLTSKHEKERVAGNICETCCKIVDTCEDGHKVIENKDIKKYIEIHYNNNQIKRDDSLASCERIKYLTNYRESYNRAVVKLVDEFIDKMDKSLPTKYNRVYESIKKCNSEPTVDNLHKYLKNVREIKEKDWLVPDVMLIMSDSRFRRLDTVKPGDEIETLFSFGKDKIFRYCKGTVLKGEDELLDLHWEDGDIWTDIYNNRKTLDRIFRFVDKPEKVGCLY
jgi:uncharacterized protein YpiB (UPF0302 family)